MADAVPRNHDTCRGSVSDAIWLQLWDIVTEQKARELFASKREAFDVPLHHCRKISRIAIHVFSSDHVGYGKR